MTDAELAAARLVALLEAEREITALRVEVMYLRGERAAVAARLAYLREERAAVVAWLYRNSYDDTAERIERGEHRREEGA